MKRRILLVDDEVAVLLTLKAVLEISGFDVDTAASGREGRSKLRAHQYHMVITDMRMESDAAGIEVISAARRASYHPAVALLTAFPIADEDWLTLGADKMLIKPMHTRVLLQQIEKLLVAHESKLSIWSVPSPTALTASKAAKPAPAKSSRPSRPAAKQPAAKQPAAKKPAAKKPAAKKPAAKKPLAGRSAKNIPAKKSSAKRVVKTARPAAKSAKR
jgi:DNA-binding response OmpR family regulator